MISDNALTVLGKRYFLEGEDWDKLVKRVVGEISKDEEKNKRKEWRTKYYDLLYNLKFLPNTPTLTNAGMKGTYSACFTIGVEDNMVSIMNTAKYMAIITQFGGGVGCNYSKIRQKGARVGDKNGVASGPVSFLRIHNSVLEGLKQGGTRRAAGMALLSIEHPDIIEFIECKKDTSEINNFNISVIITDKFMESVKNNEDWDLLDTVTKEPVTTLKAKDLFNKIVQNAWETGEPGLFFIDEANTNNEWGYIDTVNPCGEQPLLCDKEGGECCNLGSIDLSKYAFDIDNKELKKDVFTAVRFLDSVISRNKFPLPRTKEMTLETRKIGLGIMGLADYFIMNGLVYGSKESLKEAKIIMRNVQQWSIEASEELYKEKGGCKATEELGLKRRNLMVNTIAPTGTLSIIADTSSGCEPIFAVGFVRKAMGDTKLEYFHKHFIKMMGRAEVELTKEIKDKIFTNLSIQNIEEIPKHIRKIFVTASDISPENHVKMQASLQKYVDSSISKTINLPSEATKEDVEKAYLLAYELGCKGITVYRDGCRPDQVLSVKKEEPSRKVTYRLTKMQGTTEKVETPFGSMLLTINENSKGEPVEVIITIGRSGANINGLFEALGRSISMLLQHRVSLAKIARQLKGIRGEETLFHDKRSFKSLIDFIGYRLGEFVKNKEEEITKTFNVCPECGSPLIMTEGCMKCVCGYSKC